MTRRLPRPRLRCPSCGNAPRLQRDLRQRFRCSCGAALLVARVHVHPPARQLAGASERQGLQRVDTPDLGAGALVAGLPIARPYPVYRGRGAARERTWGAAVDTPVEPGDTIQIVAQSGRTWPAVVAETRGSALRGKPWESDPEPDTDLFGRDPAWLHDTSGDVG